jgi:myo-inositol-1(or 4)-monophosphatase
MRKLNEKTGLAAAIEAARLAGALMRKNLNEPKKINESIQHDIKLDLDVRCQKLIETHLSAFDAAVFGEEGISGDPAAEYRWVIDPIDGTVNFTYGIPHACVSIALQQRHGKKNEYVTVAGVVYDPFVDELWTATSNGAAKLNGKKISVSAKTRLDESIVSMGFAKSTDTMNQMLPHLNDLVYKVRKVRIMGSAALSMVYVASGRFDAYLEGGVRLWDIAAGGLILERAGGEFWRQAVDENETYRLIANNGRLRKKLNLVRK